MDHRLAKICSEHGAFMRFEAAALGYHDHAIAKAVARREWVRVRRGAYTLVQLYDAMDIHQRYDVLCRAVVRQSKTEVVLSHTSSLGQWGCPLWDAELATVHLTRRDGRTGRREAGVAQHRGILLDGDTVTRNGLFVTRAERAAIEYTTVADVEHALVEIDDLLHRRIVTIGGLRACYESSMTQWPLTLTTDLVLRLADARSESVGESRIRYLCWAHGLPAPEVNYPIYDEHGREVARVDLAWPELGVFLEFDGLVKYERLLKDGERASDVVVREKRREEMICRLTGWRCIRTVWADLYTPSATAARIRGMFRSVAI